MKNNCFHICDIGLQSRVKVQWLSELSSVVGVYIIMESCLLSHVRGGGWGRGGNVNIIHTHPSPGVQAGWGSLHWGQSGGDEMRMLET